MLPSSGRSSGRQKRHSVGRLQRLYSELLQRTDTANDVQGRQRVDNDFPENPIHRLSLSNIPLFQKHVKKGDKKESDDSEKDFAAAFYRLAATKSAGKEGNILGEIAVRDDASASALAAARSLERRVIDLIRSIGEAVVNNEPPPLSSTLKTDQTLRSDPVFEYFSEKAILSFLVDIVQEKPSLASRSPSSSCFHGVVWSPSVKTQVLQTVTLMVSGLQDSALYYILSQNCVNQIINCILPFQQWTDPALEMMLPAYIDLLKHLTLQLGGDPHLFPFFTVQQGDSKVLFPLFSAILETMKSSYAQSNSFVNAACLNLIVDIMQTSHPPIQAWVCQAEDEQQRLADHLCFLLLRRYRRIANLTTGPIVDSIRSGAIGNEFIGLNSQIDALNDLFFCEVRGLNVRLCETLLRRFVSVLLKDILPSPCRPFLCVGVVDVDVIPDREAMAQVATSYFAKLFQKLEYDPFVRMLAVTLFHPRSTVLWHSKDLEALDEYTLTPALNALVEGNDNSDGIENPFRAELLKTLKGEYGNWRFVTAAMVIESAIKSESLVLGTLASLKILSCLDEGNEYVDISVEAALASFLGLKHTRASDVSTMSLECASSLAIQIICLPAQRMVSNGKVSHSFDHIYNSSLLWEALCSTCAYFFQQTLRSQKAMGVSDIFVDLVEAAVQARYKRITPATGRKGSFNYAYLLSQHGCTTIGASPEVLIRKLRCVDSNDVEVARFNALMALHFRAVKRVIQCFFTKLNSSTPGAAELSHQDLVDEAGELSNIFASVRDQTPVGTDLDLQGRMTFFFTNEFCEPSVEPGRPHSRGLHTYDCNSTARRALVLDPTDMFVVNSSEMNRGTVVCCIPLLDVVAAAVDGHWLHLAVRHGDVESIIFNGNMALRLESPGGSLIVKQYFDRCRQVLRCDLLQKIKTILSEDDIAISETGQTNSTSVVDLKDSCKV